MITLKDVFERELPRLMPAFRYRDAQHRLSERILEVMHDQTPAIFEAGTGSGKTLAYLVPAMMADPPVIVSTGTKNLQDQLVMYDLPMLETLFPERRIALLKGRSNYLCPYRLRRNLDAGHADQQLLSGLMEIRSWYSRSATGDLNELLDPEDNRGLLSRVTSTRDNCLGSRCPDFADCPLYRARQRAAEADLVVVNHHLLFADLARSDDAITSLLPKAGSIVIDEAHQVPSIAREFFGSRLSGGQLVSLARDIRSELALLGNDDPVALGAVAAFEQRVSSLARCLLESEQEEFKRWEQEPGARDSVLAAEQALVELGAALERVADRSEGLRHCSGRAAAMVDDFVMLTEPTGEPVDTEWVHWIERTSDSFVIARSPLTIADELGVMIDASDASWIFTSATLSVDGSVDHFADELGLVHYTSEQLPSPFDYSQVTRGLVPLSLPPPGSDDHTAALVACCLPLIRAHMGRSFFLFTSHRALRTAAGCLQGFERPVFVQGNAARSEVIRRFRENDGSVLLATQSFWEGVDLRGTSLRLLVIDKLPFPNPFEPLFRAQSARIDATGKSSFNLLSLPRAAISLKQGFGRLIREETDTGLFVLGDVRALKRGYGPQLLANLPEMTWLDDPVSAEAWLRSNASGA